MRGPSPYDGIGTGGGGGGVEERGEASHFYPDDLGLDFTHQSLDFSYFLLEHIISELLGL